MQNHFNILLLFIFIYFIKFHINQKFRTILLLMPIHINIIQEFLLFLKNLYSTRFSSYFIFLLINYFQLILLLFMSMYP